MQFTAKIIGGYNDGKEIDMSTFWREIELVAGQDEEGYWTELYTRDPDCNEAKEGDVVEYTYSRDGGVI